MKHKPNFQILERVRKEGKMSYQTKMIRELSEQDKPYEKCQALGAGALTDAELLAVLIRTGTEGSSSIELAHQILRLNSGEENLQNLHHATIQELMRIRGVGQVKATQLVCLCELARRLSRASRGEKIVFRQAKKIAEYYMEEVRHLEQEELRCIFLNTKCHFIGDKVITRGTVNTSLISPREVFIEALKRRAVNLVLLHNHPSGDPAPSLSDIEVTRTIRQAGELLGISLADHIIIGDQCYVSLKERGLLT